MRSTESIINDKKIFGKDGQEYQVRQLTLGPRRLGEPAGIFYNGYHLQSLLIAMDIIEKCPEAEKKLPEKLRAAINDIKSLSLWQISIDKAKDETT